MPVSVAFDGAREGDGLGSLTPPGEERGAEASTTVPEREQRGCEFAAAFCAPAHSSNSTVTPATIDDDPSVPTKPQRLSCRAAGDIDGPANEPPR